MASQQELRVKGIRGASSIQTRKLSQGCSIDAPQAH